MSSVKHLREFICARLTAAATEIFLEFEKTIIQYEEEINHQRKLLEFIWKPQTVEARQQHDSESQQQIHSSLDQEEPAQMEEINQNGEHLVLEDETGLEVKYISNDQMGQAEEGSCAVDQDEAELLQNPEESELVLKQEPETFIRTPEIQNVTHLEAEPISSQLFSDPLAKRCVQEPSDPGILDSSVNPKQMTSDSNAENCSGLLHRAGSPEKSFKCEICGRSFKKRSRMWRHRNVHRSLCQHSRRNQEVPPQQLLHQDQEKPPTIKEELQEVHVSEGGAAGISECEEEAERSKDISHQRLFAKEEEITNSERSSGMDQDKAEPSQIEEEQQHPPTNEEAVPFLPDHEAFTGTPNQMDCVEKPYVCKRCGKSFRHRCRLVVHVRSHDNHRPFSCNVCTKGFFQKTTLIDHMKIHTGEKAFSCTICSKSFSRSHTLTVHMKIHTGEKPYSCPDCGKCFRHSQSFTIHKRIHTGEKPYSCSICGRNFFDNGSLVVHTRTHTGEQPFSCDLCGKRFAMKGTLTVHRRIHTGELPYVCKICPERFRCGHGLTVHMKSHAPQQVQ